MATGLRDRDRVNELDFSSILNLLDTLHDAVTTRRLRTVSDLDQRVIAGWLEDIQHTTTEILQEIDRR